MISECFHVKGADNVLTSKQRAYLRSLGHDLDPVFQIGKAGLTKEIVRELDDVLEARELIKVSVLQNCFEDSKEIAEEVAEQLGADVVQKIGRKFLLYRVSEDDPKIELP